MMLATNPGDATADNFGRWF